MPVHDGPCLGCRDQERLGRRRVLKLLATGAVLALAGCTESAGSTVRAIRSRHRALPPTAPPSPVVTDSEGGPPLDLPDTPPPRPGSPQVISGGPPGTTQVALTVDDGYCGECIASYVEFAEASGVPMTFNPNGTFGSLWTPQVVASMRRMIANRQVQVGNHTWDHANLLTLSASAIEQELTRNEDWIQQTFGITARPYFRPPYGYYNSQVEQVAAGLGYTSILMWNGTFGDATEETPQQIMALAEQWLQPGTIMLGHMNHPEILPLLGQIHALIQSRGLEPVTLDEMLGTSRVTG